MCGKGEEEGRVDGPAAEARFMFPTGLALDMNEDLIVADSSNHSVRKVALPDGRVTTVAGSVEGGEAGKGYADGTGTAARFHGPYGVAVDGSNAILVSDSDNNRVRKISLFCSMYDIIFSLLDSAAPSLSLVVYWCQYCCCYYSDSSNSDSVIFVFT